MRRDGIKNSVFFCGLDVIGELTQRNRLVTQDRPSVLGGIRHQPFRVRSKYLKEGGASIDPVSVRRPIPKAKSGAVYAEREREREFVRSLSLFMALARSLYRPLHPSAIAIAIQVFIIGGRGGRGHSGTITRRTLRFPRGLLIE